MTSDTQSAPLATSTDFGVLQDEISAELLATLNAKTIDPMVFSEGFGYVRSKKNEPIPDTAGTIYNFLFAAAALFAVAFVTLLVIFIIGTLSPSWGPQWKYGYKGMYSFALYSVPLVLLSEVAVGYAIHKEESKPKWDAVPGLDNVADSRKKLGTVRGLFSDASPASIVALDNVANNLDRMATVKQRAASMLTERESISATWLAVGRSEQQIEASMAAAERAEQIVDEHAATLSTMLDGLSGAMTITQTPSVGMTGQELEAAARNLATQTEQAVASLAFSGSPALGE